MNVSASLNPDAAISLMLAVIASSDSPLVLLDGQLRVVAASKSFCRTFEIDPRSVSGQLFFTLGSGEWDVAQLGALLKATLSGFVDIRGYEIDFKRRGRETRCLVLNAEKLDYADVENVRLLLTVSDVTDARTAERLKDALVRDKEILLQELQHRIANSLQIISSVLLQSARKVQSEETRGHLQDAHNRVLSVAAVQKQLAVTKAADVQLRPYLTDLCRSIGASMIYDPKVLTLDVTADDSAVGSEVSVSLGLIVTELVINALKHAFPDQRSGKIRVDYHSFGPNWTLSVGDNGVGMPTAPNDAKPGLGTSIIEALAKQLDATILVARSRPGTEVSIKHKQVRVVPEVARAV